eukprot:jgi/Bigna1/81992/fgenesh1_pg.86_\
MLVAVISSCAQSILHWPFWWVFWSTGPLSGCQRSLFYAVLLVLALRDDASPLNAGHTLDVIADPIYVPALKFLRVYPLQRATVSLWEAVAKFSWICCILGLGGWISRATLAMAGMVLHGVQSGSCGSQHRWVIPMYTFWALVFCDTEEEGTINRNIVKYTIPFEMTDHAVFCCCTGDIDDFSLDSWLLGAIQGNVTTQGEEGTQDYSTLLKPSFSVFRTGLGRQIVVLLSCFTFFAGGVSKLRESGYKWLDGKTIQYHLHHAQAAWAPGFARYIADRLWICKLLSWQTIVYEVTCYAAMISPFLRFAVFAQAVMLHTGIALTMKPKVGMAAWCYTLAFDLLPLPTTQQASAPSSHYHHHHIAPEGYFIGIAVYGALSVMIYLGWKGLEAWPFTSVPMYAQHREIEFDPYPESRKQIAAIRNWNTCRCWSQQWARIIVETKAPNKPRTYRSLMSILIEKGHLPKHTTTEYLRSVWEVAIDYARKKDPQVAIAFLQQWSQWLEDHPYVLGGDVGSGGEEERRGGEMDGGVVRKQQQQQQQQKPQYMLRFKLRMRRGGDPRKRKSMRREGGGGGGGGGAKSETKSGGGAKADGGIRRRTGNNGDDDQAATKATASSFSNDMTRSSNCYYGQNIIVSDAGEREANGKYKPQRKADGSYRLRDGVCVYRRLSRSNSSNDSKKRSGESEQSKESQGGEMIRYTLCRALSKTTNEHKWWLYKNAKNSGGKWSKPDVDLYNVIAEIPQNADWTPGLDLDVDIHVPPSKGWKVLTAFILIYLSFRDGVSPAPSCSASSAPTVQRNDKNNGMLVKGGEFGSLDEQLADEKEMKNSKDYQLGTIASCKVNN